MNDMLKNFINESVDLINENTKDSWEKIYRLFLSGYLYGLSGEFTKMILDAGINDPASIMGYVPDNYLYESTIQDYKLPDNVISIGAFAFAHCDSLTEIIIPNGVVDLDVGAFDACRSLTNIILPDSVTEITLAAFRDCSSLTNIVIPNSVISIGEEVFQNCGNLTSVVIPDSITSISKSTFSSCSSLTSVVIPNSVTSIDEYAFSYCGKLEEITYKGTRKQAIQLGIGNKSRKKWRANSSIKKIICSDGVVEL